MGQLGNVCIKLPTPPYFMTGIYQNKATIYKNFSVHHGYYYTGDAGYFDIDGYLYVMSRVGDMMNTAGHRLSTM